jgi:hypothetical protein
MIEIVERRYGAHAFAHVLVIAGHLHQLVEEFFGKKVRVRVYAHRRSSVDLAVSWSPFPAPSGAGLSF